MIRYSYEESKEIHCSSHNKGYKTEKILIDRAYSHIISVGHIIKVKEYLEEKL